MTQSLPAPVLGFLHAVLPGIESAAITSQVPFTGQGINTMEDLIAASIGDRRTTMQLLLIFAIIAAILAALEQVQLLI